MDVVMRSSWSLYIYVYYHHDEQGVWNAFTGLLTRRSREHWIYCYYALCTITIICTVHYAQCTMHYQYKLPWLPPTTDQTWVLLVLGRALCRDLQCITAQDWRFFDLSGTKSLGAFLPAGFKFSLQSDAMTLPLTNEFRDELNLQCITQLKIWSGRGSWKPFSVALFLKFSFWGSSLKCGRTSSEFWNQKGHLYHFSTHNV